MASPAASIEALDPVQGSARVGLEIAHYLVRASFRFYDQVNVVASDVGSEEIPAAMGADLSERFQHDLAPVGVERIRGIIHPVAFRGNPSGISVQCARSEQIPPTVHGAGLIAMKMGSVAGECDEVSHFFETDSLTVAAHCFGCAAYFGRGGGRISEMGLFRARDVVVIVWTSL